MHFRLVWWGLLEDRDLVVPDEAHSLHNLLPILGLIGRNDNVPEELVHPELEVIIFGELGHLTEAV